MAEDNRERLIEKLYEITIADIRELKARQWDVSKWVLAGGIGLLGVLGIGSETGGGLDDWILHGVASAAAGLFALAFGAIVKTQFSLTEARNRLRWWRQKHRALHYAYAIAGEKEGQTSIWYDWQIWVPMLFITTAATLGPFFGALALLCP